jgi:uncharacterized protein involved in response to NO
MATALPFPPPSRTQHFEVLRARDEAVAKLLMAFISSGLVFMVFPGTFLGVWNLLQISGRESVASIAPAWIQAHGHAQVFGWVGSFIMGIGFFSIPRLRAGAKASFGRAWACWAMWTAGVALRWATNVYRWEWRVLLPVSAVLELAAFLIFFRAVSQHQSQESGKKQLEPWIWVVINASMGFLLLLILNLSGCLYVAFRGATPAFPHVFDQRYLALMAWGFLVPFVWGFSAKWMGVFLGLKAIRPRILLSAVLLNLTGIALALAGSVFVGVWFFLGASVLAIVALRMFEAAIHEPKTRGVHASFPLFIRLAYVWLLIAAGLGVAAARWDHSGGIWGASRHALTVGFISVMIVSVGQRILPAFAGMRQLWKPRLMFTALLLLTFGCTLRVSCEVLAYQEYVHGAWRLLPLSALFELAGLTAFAINLAGTFVLQPSHAVNEPMVAGISGANI